MKKLKNFFLLMMILFLSSCEKENPEKVKIVKEKNTYEFSIFRKGNGVNTLRSDNISYIIINNVTKNIIAKGYFPTREYFYLVSDGIKISNDEESITLTGKVERDDHSFFGSGLHDEEEYYDINELKK